MRAAPAALAVIIAFGCVSACGGGTSTTARQAATSPPATVTHHGGLIGTIDTARLVAVCADARQADEALQGGMDAGTVDPILQSIIGLLQRPPVDPAVQALAGPVQQDLSAGRRDHAVAAVLAFCRRNQR